MEESLHQFRQQLSINEDSEHQFGGYLKYIQSKYPKVADSDLERMNSEWEVEFQESQAGTLEGHLNGTLLSAQATSQIVAAEVDESAPSELLLVSTLYSGGSIGSPSPVLFDNFIEEDGTSTGIDFGDYMPSGLSISASTAAAGSVSIGSSVLGARPSDGGSQSSSSLAAVTGCSSAAEEIEDLSDDDEEADLQAVEEDEDRDFFCSEHLPARVLEALSGMRNTDMRNTDSSPHGADTVTDDRYAVGSIEISDVYEFVEEDE